MDFYLQVLVQGNSSVQLQNQFTRWCLCHLSPPPPTFIFLLKAEMNCLPTLLLAFHQLKQQQQQQKTVAFNSAAFLLMRESNSLMTFLLWILV